MATHTAITLIDDLDGTEATQTIQFAFDGSQYEIDLNDDNAAAFRKTLQDYIDHARKATGNRSSTRRGRRGERHP